MNVDGFSRGFPAKRINVNPFEGIEMSSVNNKGRDGRNENREGSGARVGDQTSAGMQPPPVAPTRRNQPRSDNVLMQREVETVRNNENL